MAPLSCLCQEVCGTAPSDPARALRDCLLRTRAQLKPAAFSRLLGVPQLHFSFLEAQGLVEGWVRPPHFSASSMCGGAGAPASGGLTGPSPAGSSREAKLPLTTAPVSVEKQLFTWRHKNSGWCPFPGRRRRRAWPYFLLTPSLCQLGQARVACCCAVLSYVRSVCWREFQGEVGEHS